MEKLKLIKDIFGNSYKIIWIIMKYKTDLNELDNLQKTIRDLNILKENCVEEDIQHWENLIWYYTALQKGEIEY